MSNNYNTNNVIVGVAQVYYAPYGKTTPGSPEPAPADPGAPRTDTATVTSGSSTITDSTIALTDKGQPVTSVTVGAIPANSYVGTVTADTSFVLVNAAGTPVNATAAATSIEVGTGIAKGMAWGGNWTPIGGTDQGVTLSVNSSENAISIEEQFNPALYTMDSASIQVSFTLDEDTVENMLLAYGMGTIATQAATASLIGKKTLQFATTLNPYSVGFESGNTFVDATSGLPMFRRVYIPKMFSGGAKVDTVYRRAKAARMYAVTLSAVCDPSTILILDQTSNHT